MEASFAGALGVRLGGTLAYGGRVEHRPVLNGAAGRAVRTEDIERAVRLSRRVGVLALGVCAASTADRGTAVGHGAAPGRGTERRMSGGLLVAGTTSDAGKSVVTAGICRWLVRQGVKVAPFKAQNMSLNSFVTREGAEIGRAQAMQAQAARVEPTALMNPVLLKPGSDRSSQVVLMGRPVGEMSARGYHEVAGVAALHGRGLSGAASGHV